MKIICSFDSFKGCMTAMEACYAAKSGLQKRYPLCLLMVRRADKQGIPVHLLSGAIENATELKDAGFATVHSINENDNRPLEVLMQKDIATDNMKKTTEG